DEASDEAAAVVVPEHPLVAAVRNDQHLAATGGLERYGAGTLPLTCVEPCRHRCFAKRRGHHHRMPTVAHYLRVSHRSASPERRARAAVATTQLLRALRRFPSGSASGPTGTRAGSTGCIRCRGTRSPQTTSAAA